MTEIQKRNNNSPVTASKVVNQAISQIQKMVDENYFDIPDSYSYKNAIQQSRYLLQKPLEGKKNAGKTILEVCTPQSILNAVMEMAQKGLNPSKKQCYFIPYGNTCTLSISYQGNVAMGKRSGQDIGDVFGYAVYKDDDFKLGFNIKKGTIEIEKYVPNVEKWTKENIVGAFALITDSKGDVKYTEYMTMEQIKDAWGMGAAKGNSPAHKNFPDQQAIKTVKNRAVKSFVNTSDDKDMISDDERSTVYTDNEFEHEVEENANTMELPVDEGAEKEVPENVEKDTGEIVEDEEVEGQSDFFDDDFEELTEAPY